MVLMSSSRGRTDGKSNYRYVVGNDELAQLVSRVQATAIRIGHELEDMIASRSDTSITMDDLLDGREGDGTYLIRKKSIKSSRIDSTLEPDLLIIKHFPARKQSHCYIVELKAGDNFDTKKAAGEVANLESFKNALASHIPYTLSVHLCCFNQEDRGRIVHGLKKKITEDQALTGRELCALLEIDFDEIQNERIRDARENLRYFVSCLLSIDELQTEIKRQLTSESA